MSATDTAATAGDAASERAGATHTAEDALSGLPGHQPDPTRPTPAGNRRRRVRWMPLLAVVAIMVTTAATVIEVQSNVRSDEVADFRAMGEEVADAIGGEVDLVVTRLESATEAVLASGTDEDAVRLVPELLDSRGLILVETDGNVVAATNDGSVGTNVADRAHITRAFAEVRGVSGLIRSISDGSPIYVVAVELDDGRVASLAWSVDDGLLVSALPPGATVEGSAWWIVDGVGETLTSLNTSDAPSLERFLSGGTIEGWEFTTAEIPGTGWRLANASRSEVVHPRSEGLPAVLPWVLFALLAGAGTLALVMQGRAAERADELARTNTELARTNAELARSNEDLEQFAYAASHDLQEPLRKVASYTELLERRYGDKLDDRARTYIHYAVDGATRMQALIQDLLAFSRAGQTDRVTVDSCDLDAIFRRALDAVSGSVAEAGADVLLPDEAPRVRGDRTQLTMAVQNLLSNAVKFRSPERPCQVRVSAVPIDGGMVDIVVRDNGIGVPAEHREHVFGVFQRLHGHSEAPGTGVGLALVRRIAERNGGRAWITANDGPGSAVHVVVPDADRAGYR